MLKQRVITAVILAGVVIAAIMLEDSFWISLLFTLALILACREFIRLTLKIPEAAAVIAALGFGLLFWLSLQRIDAQIVYLQSIFGACLWILIACALVFYRHHGHWPLLMRVLILGLGLDLLWICAHGLLFLHRDLGGEILLFALTLVCFADIGAYFGGRRFGKHKLAPAISPGKTWEGVAGGLVANLLWMTLVYWAVTRVWPVAPGLDPWWFILIGLATSAVSVVGDLFESVVKREAGVKDSGTLLPGHGGILDRIDGVIAASPVFVSGIFLASSA